MLAAVDGIAAAGRVKPRSVRREGEIAGAGDLDPLNEIHRAARRIERVDEDALLRAVRRQAADIDEHLRPSSPSILPSPQAGTAISRANSRICGASSG